MRKIESHGSFGGTQEVWAHDATSTSCEMRFGVFLPPQAQHTPCPVLYFLSGLTCTEQNFIQKSGMQRYAAEHGLIIVSPDTSPRGEGVPDAEGDDIGLSAGFYVDATQAPWSAQYRMQSYVTQELPTLVEAHFPASDMRGITGHSMGGHGALICALRNPGFYRSVSALAPICSASRGWGRKAFAAYFGEDADTWRRWDACDLLRASKEKFPLLVDQGDADPFLEDKLQPDLLRAACDAGGHALDLRMRRGYDHGFYFVASFVGDHVAHHAAALTRA
ncbi:S-formylglutathione hydrolase [Lysobacter dokdonensis DS-58]|uniref:S-formylglutathione hydrolase n=1 Tax=Lysobacter dokdonensis DS-58 TaxID=1300345 RepID=A0A0A2WH73_9GAMM|nr:S-formylglutathione hydrolase [Lysobacter dokdonensis]KGQ18057.1 S-formylglutathione hydrolase [Lysobacter dokdonensis DS-58]